MRILSLFLGVAVIANSMALRAEDKKVYEAVVDSEQGEFVLSGPGTKYYPTQKLKNGERVMVHRHDPGGICMIAPPRGSFSWVRASQVDREGENKGWIKTNRVVVHTGSICNPEECTTIQADLSKGDAVEILGEKEFQFEDGPRLMLKISPVKGEWRWISRKSIVAADSYRSTPSSDDQPLKKRTGPIADGEAFAQPISTSTLNPDDRLDGPAADSTNRSELDVPSGRDRLSMIDQQFREMIKQDPPAWNLDQLESQYRQLDTELNQKMITSMVILRLDAVKRYRKIHQDYLDFHRLTSATKQRDAELLVQQTQFQSQMTGNVPPSMIAAPDAQPATQITAPQTVATAQAPTSAAPQFDGAGIVQRMSKTFPGGPQYVLISPEGKMLSFLQTTPGVDLNRFNGRSVGVVGQRVHRNDWNADVIAVQTLQPVQLRATR